MRQLSYLSYFYCWLRITSQQKNKHLPFIANGLYHFGDMIMKYFLMTILVLSVFCSSVQASNTLPLANFVKPKIVGGESATPGDWPWMSALIFTQNSLASSLTVTSSQYLNDAFLNSPTGTVSAAIVDCGIGDNLCPLANNKICLIARGDIDFSDKATNCQASGGIGAIIYNNVAGMIDGTLGENFLGTIPVVAISQTDGAALLNKVNSIATITVIAQQAIAQNASCGASFIGGRWLLTAAHCVEGVSINEADITFLKVKVGAYDLADDLSKGAESVQAIKRIYIHPEYKVNTTFNNDIALIELVETVNPDQQAISLVNNATSEQLALNNSAVTVIGWGNIIPYGPKDELPGNSQPDKLQQVELSLLTNSQCKTKLAQAYTELEGITYLASQVGITDSMICAESLVIQPPTGAALTNGKGSCQGDSGGPLIVATHLGWQQLGIVSYGVGCGVAAFPDVYTRVGNFTSWIESITKGIAIEPSYNFAITPQNTAQTAQLTVTNHSNSSANLTFSLSAEKLSSSAFTLNTGACQFLAAQQSCQLLVKFDAKRVGLHKIKITINSDNIIPASYSIISAQALAEDNNINTQLSGGSTTLRWFNGGDKPWILDNTEAAIKSGNIGNNQQSAVLLNFFGAGSLSFEWAVSSEENTNNTNDPFDALYLIVDGKQASFISGGVTTNIDEVTYTKVTLDNLAGGEHNITWLYKKDAGTSAGKDQGYLRNVIFTPSITASVPPVSPTLAEDATDNKSSGGSIYFLLLMLTLLTSRTRSV